MFVYCHTPVLFLGILLSCSLLRTVREKQTNPVSFGTTSILVSTRMETKEKGRKYSLTVHWLQRVLCGRRLLTSQFCALSTNSTLGLHAVVYATLPCLIKRHFAQEFTLYDVEWRRSIVHSAKTGGSSSFAARSNSAVAMRL